MKYYDDDDCPEIFEATAIKENEVADGIDDNNNQVTGDQA